MHCFVRIQLDRIPLYEPEEAKNFLIIDEMAVIERKLSVMKQDVSQIKSLQEPTAAQVPLSPALYSAAVSVHLPQQLKPATYQQVNTLPIRKPSNSNVKSISVNNGFATVRKCVMNIDAIVR